MLSNVGKKAKDFKWKGSLFSHLLHKETILWHSPIPKTRTPSSSLQASIWTTPSPLSQKSICLSLLWWIIRVFWWDPSKDGRRDETFLKMKGTTTSSGNIMKWNKIRLRGTKREGRHWPMCSWSEHNSSQGDPSYPGGPSGENATTAMALKEGNTLQRTTFPPVHSILNYWMEAFIWASREGRVDDMKNDSEENHILWSSINWAFNPGSWKASVVEGSTQPCFSFLTPRPLPSPAFSKKVKEYENQIDDSKTGPKVTKMKIMKTKGIFQNKLERAFPFNSRFLH